MIYGHLKNHRPDLKQVVMPLVVNGAGAIPVWMEPQDGNSSEKKTFHERIKKIRTFQRQLKDCYEFKWIADLTMYHKDKPPKKSDYLWISRVPETILEAQICVEKVGEEINWFDRKKGYKTSSFLSNYKGVKQRWLKNLSELRIKIIRLFGVTTQKIYGIT